MTQDEIRANYKVQHNVLSESYYNGTSGLTKEQFDILHGQVWGGMEAELIAGGFITISEPAMDLEKEVETIKAEIAILKVKVEEIKVK